MTPYAAWSPMTDTVELPSLRRGIPLVEQPTQQLEFYPMPELQQAPHRRRRRVRRLLVTVGVTGLIVGLLLAIVALHALTPVTGIW